MEREHASSAAAAGQVNHHMRLTNVSAVRSITDGALGRQPPTFHWSSFVHTFLYRLKLFEDDRCMTILPHDIIFVMRLTIVDHFLSVDGFSLYRGR